MTGKLKELYLEFRKPSFIPWSYRHADQINPLVYGASTAIRWARDRIECDDLWNQFTDMGGEVVSLSDWKKGRHSCTSVAIVEHPDDTSDFEDVCGDTYNPDVNVGIKPEILAKEKQEFLERINRDGVYGYRGFFKGADGKWHETDSIWGTVGGHFKHSGYDTDILKSIFNGLEEHASETNELEQFAEEVQ